MKLKSILCVLMIFTLLCGSVSALAEPEKAEDQTLYLVRTDSSDKASVLNPWQYLRNVDGNQLFRCLLSTDALMVELYDDLATGYEMSDDGLTYTLTLKDDLKWSDGVDVTAEDVKWSVEASVNGFNTNSLFTTAFKHIEGYDAWKNGEADEMTGITIDGNTITFQLTDTYGAFANVLAAFAILPEHVLSGVASEELYLQIEYWGNPVVCGRFMVTEMNEGNYYVMEPNPYFEGTAAIIEKIIITFADDISTAAQNGSVDFFGSYNLDEIQLVSDLGTYTTVPANILFFRFFNVLLEGNDGFINETMSDYRVRLALTYAIDYDTVIEGVFGTMAERVTTGVPAYRSESVPADYTYDPDMAKQLLDETGYDYNHEFTILYYNNDQYNENFLDAVVYYLQQIGMTVKKVYTTNAGVDILQTRDYDIVYQGLSAYSMISWYELYTRDSYQAIYPGYEAFNDLTVQLSKTPSSSAEYAEILAQLQALDQECLYRIPLYTLNYNFYLSTARLYVPENMVWGNPWYNWDYHFEDWYIID